MTAIIAWAIGTVVVGAVVFVIAGVMGGWDDDA